MDVSHSIVEANDLDAFYAFLKLEWISMCKMYHLVKEVKWALATYPDLGKQMQVKTMNLKRIVLKYGPKLGYTLQVSWPRDAKFYEITLGIDRLRGSKPSVDSPFLNYHIYFAAEIRRFFAMTPSLVNLAHVLNGTCVATFGLAKLANLPKFYAKQSGSALVPHPGFMLLARSLTHLRLVYYSRYCIDVHIEPDSGLVAIRDASFCLTDINATIDELLPIQYLASFLAIFIDESQVQELLRKRSSFDEEPNR